SRSVRCRLRNNQQGPIVCSLPFLLKTGPVLFEKLATCGVIQEQQLPLRIDPNDNNVMQRSGCGGFEGNDQGVALFYLAGKVLPLTGEHKSTESVLLKVLRHCRG